MEHQTVTKTNQAGRQNQATCCTKPDSNPLESIHLFRELHQRMGNHALGRRIQAKLNISQPNDASEQEADRMAEEVMRMPDPGDDQSVRATKSPAASSQASRLYRKCAGCEEEEELQRKEIPGGRILTDVGPGEFVGGQPLSSSDRSFFEPRFGRDFSQVRIHTDARAAESARSVNARAYTVGPNIVFGAGQYPPRGTAEKTLLAHELTHVVQAESPLSLSQAAPTEGSSRLRPGIGTRVNDSIISRAPLYPDTSCANVQDSITRAWPTAKLWVQHARSRLADAAAVASYLQTHFKLDPNDTTQAGDLTTVRQVFSRMAELFDMDINNRCNPADRDDECHLPDGRRYAAFVNAGLPENGIRHCLPSADVSFLGQASLIDTLVHEVAHLADPASTDFAYRHEAAVTSYENMTRAQAIRNGDSYSEFAKDLYMGTASTPLLLGLSTGVLLSTGRPRWAIGASYDIRSRSGIEVFDLVGGIHGFIALDVGAPSAEPAVRDVGGELNIGVITRSAETRMFLDTRVGGFVTADAAHEEPARAGLSSSTVIGWADSRFRAGVNLRLLYDFLQGNHAVIIGGEFNFGL